MPPKNFTPTRIKQFKDAVWRQYHEQGRHNMPWRHTKNPYRITVSEIMLQQTQVERVKRYYTVFLRAFPTWQALDRASLKDVLALWQGMGYNRRAKYLKQMAQQIVHAHHSKFPRDFKILTTLPGVGKATAGAILTYTYNAPVPFIETNIRRAYLHWFFADDTAVHDRDIMELVEQTIDRDNPREWYWALMDYGTMLALTTAKTANPNRRSKHYTRQSKFSGSTRELRGKIIALLLKKPHTKQELLTQTTRSATEVDNILTQLMREQLIQKQSGKYSI